MKHIFITLIISLAVFSQAPAQAGADFFDPISLFLTWQNDPTSTMTIDWHTIDANRESVVSVDA
jgi:hypothetical protein